MNQSDLSYSDPRTSEASAGTADCSCHGIYVPAKQIGKRLITDHFHVLKVHVDS